VTHPLNARAHALRKTSTWHYRLVAKLMYPYRWCVEVYQLAVVGKWLGEGSEGDHAELIGGILLVHRWPERFGSAVGCKGDKI
jgi:hypothetical protein